MSNSKFQLAQFISVQWTSCERGSCGVYRVNFPGKSPALPESPGAIVLRRQASVGFCRWTASVSWGFECVVHTVQWRERGGRKMSLPSAPLSKQWKDTKAIYKSPSANDRGVHLFVCNLTCNTEDVLKIAWLDLSVVKNIDKLPVPGAISFKCCCMRCAICMLPGIYSFLK